MPVKIKKILLLHKKSAYALYFPQHFKRSSVFKNRLQTIQRFQDTHLIHYQTLFKVESILKSWGLDYEKHYRGQRFSVQKFDFVITVGGDGTFLEAARGITRQFILGVNSDTSWSVGRFCSADADSFENILQKVLNGRWPVKHFQRLKLKFDNSAAEMNVLNDVLICHSNPAAMSRYAIKIGGREEEQRSSGVWVATAPGSTGAIKSAGGKTLDPVSFKYQYKPRELYNLKSKPCVLKGSVLNLNQSLRVVSLMQQGKIYVDGSHVFVSFNFGRKVLITKSPHPLHVVI